MNTINEYQQWLSAPLWQVPGQPIETKQSLFACSLSNWYSDQNAWLPYKLEYVLPWKLMTNFCWQNEWAHKKGDDLLIYYWMNAATTAIITTCTTTHASRN